MNSYVSAGREGSVGELLTVAYPLIITSASSTVMQFVNRLFLARYSPDAMAACVPGGILSFAFLCFFLGLVNYSNAFVAQYFGRGEKRNISVSVWQGIWLSAAAWLVLLAALPAGIFIISHSGHDPAVMVLEKQYFTALTVPSVFPLLASPLAAFYTGRGMTKVTMIANLTGNVVCVLLSWWFIFGAGPVPALGIKGAAYASAGGQFVITAVLAALVFSDKNKAVFRIDKFWRFDQDIFLRMVRYGAPNGVGFFLDIAAFSAFVFLIGSLDKVSLAANNIIASINSIAFMPVIGVGMAGLTLVGKYIGAGRKDISEKVAFRAAGVAVAYAFFMGSLFYFFPAVFVNIFGSGGQESYAEILPLARRLMHVLAFAILFDGTGIVFADALRGAGDTKFQMVMSTLLSAFVYVPLAWAAVHYTHSVLYAWCAYGVYVTLYCICFFTRFRLGRWKKINILRE